MTGSRQTDSDRALARLLSDALEPAPGTMEGKDCPDPELLSAYSEHNLDTAESAKWEKHFAECGRCQKILAVLMVSGEEPLSEGELNTFGRKVAAAEVGGAPQATFAATKADGNRVAPFARPRTAWRWIAPAVGVAAAAALWIALRPLPHAQNVVATAQKAAEQQQAAATSGESLESRADIPAPPSVEAAPRAELQRQPGEFASREPRKKESEPNATVEQVPQQVATAAAPAPSSAQDLQAANSPATNPAEAQRTNELPVAQTASTAEPTVGAPAAPSADAVLAQKALPSLPPPSSAQSANALSTSGEQVPGSAGARAKASPNVVTGAFAARRALGAAGAPGSEAIVVVSPTGSVRWRVGLAGRIERSTDQGLSWQQQASGVASDLLAGAAPSDSVAWVAGRAGVILRTTDGQRWQRVVSPDSAVDWASITASDGLHATVTSSDGRRFTTENGGQSWKRQ